MRFRKDKGQGLVEYLLLLATVSLILFHVLAAIHTKIEKEILPGMDKEISRNLQTGEGFSAKKGKVR